MGRGECHEEEMEVGSEKLFIWESVCSHGNRRPFAPAAALPGRKSESERAIVRGGKACVLCYVGIHSKSTQCTPCVTGLAQATRQYCNTHALSLSG
jgi:hypothetical protein